LFFASDDVVEAVVVDVACAMFEREHVFVFGGSADGEAVLAIQ
jgi:hypothetical protein